MYNRIKPILNKIDNNLKEVFENVSITKLDNIKELTFEVTVSKLKDKNVTNNTEAVVIFYITENNLFDTSLIWEYKTNPLNESKVISDNITRTSLLNTLATDLATIIKENRFSKEYIDFMKNESKSTYRIEMLSDGSYVLLDEHDTELDSSLDKVDLIRTKRELIEAEENDEEYIDPIQKAHNEYEAEKMSRKYNSDEWVQAQRDDEGIDDEYDYGIDESIITDDKEGIIIYRKKLKVNDIVYNIYGINIDSEIKEVFEYDITKK